MSGFEELLKEAHTVNINKFVSFTYPILYEKQNTRAKVNWPGLAFFISVVKKSSWQ